MLSRLHRLFARLFRRDRHTTVLHYRSLFEQSNDAVFIIDLSGRHLQVNQRAADMHGYTKEEIIGMSYRSLIPPELHPKSEAVLQKLLAGERVPPYERVFRRKDGSLLSTEVNAEIVRDKDGNPLYIQSIVRDISGRKQTENALRASEERQRALLNALPDLMFRNHRDGTYLDYHAPSTEDLATHPDQLIGKKVQDILPPTVADLAMSNIQRTLQTGKEQIYEYTLTLEGQTKHFEARMVAAGQDEVLSIVRNVTERKQAQQQELELALEKERVNLLSKFVQNATHEFRTPLTIIGSSAYLLSRSDDPAYRTLKAEGITAQVNRITNLVDMLLLLTKIESQGVEPCAQISLHQVLEAVCWRTSAFYGNTPQLRREEEANLPPVMGNMEYLTEALRQILDNAYHFTPPEGVITLRTGANTTEIWVEIQDTGAGIAEDMLPYVFETFWRQDEAHSTSGFGLGLAITRQIITHHGGQVSVSSKKGQGSCFRITLPIQQEKEP